MTNEIGTRMAIGMIEGTSIGEADVEGDAHFLEDFFYRDPLDKAYHSLLFYYFCSPGSL